MRPKASGAGLICRTDQYFQHPRLPYTCIVIVGCFYGASRVHHPRGGDPASRKILGSPTCAQTYEKQNQILLRNQTRCEENFWQGRPHKYWRVIFFLPQLTFLLWIFSLFAGGQSGLDMLSSEKRSPAVVMEGMTKRALADNEKLLKCFIVRRSDMNPSKPLHRSGSFSLL